MLTHLSVRHFATVDQLELEPENGLTAISGETGAGKSVIIDALGLALGQAEEDCGAGITVHRAGEQQDGGAEGDGEARTSGPTAAAQGRSEGVLQTQRWSLPLKRSGVLVTLP